MLSPFQLFVQRIYNFDQIFLVQIVAYRIPLIDELKKVLETGEPMGSRLVEKSGERVQLTHDFNSFGSVLKHDSEEQVDQVAYLVHYNQQLADLFLRDVISYSFLLQWLRFF